MDSDPLDKPSAAKPVVRLMLVDDTQIVLDRLRATLGAITGVHVVGTAHSVAEAIPKVRQLQPDLITLDIGLDKSNGWDVLQFVKQAHPNIRVFVFSNDTGVATRARFTTGGADEFFDKSNDFGALCQAVQNLVVAHSQT